MCLHNRPVIRRVADDDLQTFFNGRDTLPAIKALAAMLHDASGRTTATGGSLINEARIHGIANAVDHRDKMLQLQMIVNYITTETANYLHIRRSWGTRHCLTRASHALHAPNESRYLLYRSMDAGTVDQQ